jgi:plastocyanin
MVKALIRALPCAALALAACSGGGGTGTPGPAPVSASPTAIASSTAAATHSPEPSATPTLTPSPSPTPVAASPSPTPVATAQPQVVHMSFSYASTSSSYGTIAFYAPTTNATTAAYITAVAGSQLLFVNSDTTTHTASGLGTSGFPSSFTNTNGPTASGSTVDGTAWSTGALAPGTSSTPFTLGPPGTYYFGCYYHYSIPMEDVIVSKAS